MNEWTRKSEKKSENKKATVVPKGWVLTKNYHKDSLHTQTLFLEAMLQGKIVVIWRYKRKSTVEHHFLCINHFWSEEAFASNSSNDDWKLQKKIQDEMHLQNWSVEIFWMTQESKIFEILTVNFRFLIKDLW